MAARRMMADEDSLDIETIRKWFNPFIQDGQKLFTEPIPVWIAQVGATARLFGVTSAQFQAAAGAERDQTRKKASKTFKERFQAIVQRRHDCIHTCDRPANAPQPINRPGTVSNVIKDIEFIVNQSDAHIDAEFRIWLLRCGFSAVTLNQVGY